MKQLECGMMGSWLKLSVLLVMVAWMGLSPSIEAAELSRHDAEVLFALKVKPLLTEKCLGCHGDDEKKIKGELDMRNLAGLLAGGESGDPTLVPGKPEESWMYIGVTWEDPFLEMPPKENDRLSAAQIEDMRQWIEAGAPWPDDEKVLELMWNAEVDSSEGVRMKTSNALSQEWAARFYKPEDLWAYQPIQKPAVPSGAKEAGAIDAFIDRKLNEVGIKAAGAADRVTLIRRATYDLTGLPPTPAEVKKFVNDQREGAWERLIERLLASPRYGEQWGRHWLDVVRYADSSGYSNDFERPNAWRYRDYVIRAFNADKPYDQFIREQLAGDEMGSDDPELLIAAGYLRMGAWEHTGMEVEAVSRQLYLDDVTNNTGEAFLGIPLKCCKCHDHKFDPIPTRDYYRFKAAFAPVNFAQREVAFLPEENTAFMAEEKALMAARLAEAKAWSTRIGMKNIEANRAWYKERGRKVPTQKEKLKLAEEDRAPRNLGLSFEDLGVLKVMKKSIERRSQAMARYEPYAFSVYNGPMSVQDGHRTLNPMPNKQTMKGPVQSISILASGAVDAPVDEVTPGVLSALPGSNDAQGATAFNTIPKSTKGRRLALANWIASEKNSLAPRVMVNRIWQYHFGKALAGNANNFGANGKKPTHPQLLDWLASYFVEHDWSVKEMHRVIMSSEVYQRSGSHTAMEVVNAKDADNALLSYFSPRRMTAEELRDSMLAMTGELNQTMGGIPAFPEINLEVAMQPVHVQGSVAPAYQPDRLPQQRNRRTIYTVRIRSVNDPLMENFNRPGTEESCEARGESVVATQAFTLLNGQFVNNRALAMAKRLEGAEKRLAKQVDLAFQLTMGRAASDAERAKCVEHVRAMVKHHQTHPVERVDLPTTVGRTMIEEMTGVDFSWVEQLDNFQNYTPDLMPWDVNAQTRGLAELCLVLLNSNEFAYLY